MKKDLDRLMNEQGVDVLYAEGHAAHDPNIFYLLNGTNIGARYIKKRGQKACVVHSPIEREVAIKTGLNLVNSNRYDFRKIFDKYGDPLKANSLFLNLIFDDLKVKGNIAFMNSMSAGNAYHFLRAITRYNKKIKIAKQTKKSIIIQARETKDRDEIKNIRSVRNGVVKAFNGMIEMVRKCKVRKNMIMFDQLTPLRLVDLRTHLERSLFEQGFLNTGGMIVAQGRDAGVPHNSGNDRETVKVGETIVFDIFPQQKGGGYFFDFTRTICFGYASKKYHEIFRLVKQAQDIAFEQLHPGRHYIEVERSVCKFFEKNSHPTFLSNPKTQQGYCHSLGHGLGLNIHESPGFSLYKTNKNKINAGHVFTVEPGLYYPDKGFGIRLEDVIYIDPKGIAVNLTNYPRKLVVDM